MCSHILRVKYKAQGEAPQLLPMENEEAVLARVGELQKLETVAELRVFVLCETRSRMDHWEISKP